MGSKIHLPTAPSVCAVIFPWSVQVTQGWCPRISKPFWGKKPWFLTSVFIVNKSQFNEQVPKMSQITRRKVASEVRVSYWSMTGNTGEWEATREGNCCRVYRETHWVNPSLLLWSFQTEAAATLLPSAGRMALGSGWFTVKVIWRRNKLMDFGSTVECIFFSFFPVRLKDKNLSISS